MTTKETDLKNSEGREARKVIKKAITKSEMAIDVLRVTPKEHKPEKNPKTDRLTDLIIVLFIFGIAMWFRFYARFEFLLAYTENGTTDFFHIKIKEGDPLGFGKFLGLKTDEHVEAEGYVDFSYYYIDYVNAFVDKDWNPYSGNLEEDDVLNGYVYGPFYIYLVAIGKAWFDLPAAESIIYSNLIFDSLSYVMVYFLAKRMTGNVNAMILAGIGSFSPIALFYANIRVLNAPQMNFFTLLFIYLYLEHRDTSSLFVLAIATLTKQFPLFLAMPVGFFLVRRYGILKGVGIYLQYFVFLLLLSIPWIVLTPNAYYTKLFLPGGGKSQISCPKGGEATNLVAGTIDLDSCNEDTIVISQLGLWLFDLINSHYLFFGSLLILSWAGFTGYDYMEKNPKLYMRFYAAFFTLAHATIARGIYKYYLTMLMPFFLLAFIPGSTDKSLNLRFGALINRGWSKWIDPRNRMKKPSVSYWILFVLLLLSMTSVGWLLHVAISLFTTTRKYHNLWLIITGILAFYFIYKPGPVPISQTEDEIPTHVHERNDFLKLGIAIALGYLVWQVAELYFSGNPSSLQRHQTLLLLILVIFITLPYSISSVTQRGRVFNSFQVDYIQVILDVIMLGINFYIFYFLNKEVFLIHRYFTTSIILAFSIFLMGLLGGEI
ncbi:MAG: glycosyltransferase family 39 protein, partial [Candidatus Kariarchaeaceae archaeon]